jgi:RimJ/RimL family protein N-acetyltransferase
MGMDLQDQPLGQPVEWTPVPAPRREPLIGTHVTVRPLSPDDAEDLFAVSHPPDGDLAIWTYLPTGPYADVKDMRAALADAASSEDPLFFSLLDNASGRPAGVASYLRMEPEHGVIEIGHIWFGVALQRTTAATEAIFLLASHAFDDLGYRRLEWKCNALNAASRRAALRFGFSFEGVFRQHKVFKGRSRDTAWFAILDADWPAIRRGFEAWLAPENFDASGRQRRQLEPLMARERS